MKIDELKELVRGGNDADILAACLTDGHAPYVCEQDDVAWLRFRKELVDLLRIDIDDIRVVGSGRFGFSLSPTKNFRPFSDQSDIDLVVVNAGLFDRLWLNLLHVAYPRQPVVVQAGGWLDKTQRDVYTGWLRPNLFSLDRRISGARIDDLVRLRADWFSGLKLAARHARHRHEDISGRLYRTWEHAERYHWYSAIALRQTLGTVN